MPEWLEAGLLEKPHKIASILINERHFGDTLVPCLWSLEFRYCGIVVDSEILLDENQVLVLQIQSNHHTRLCMIMLLHCIDSVGLHCN